MKKIFKNKEQRNEFISTAQREFYRYKDYPLPLDGDGTADSMSDEELVEWINEKCFWRKEDKMKIKMVVELNTFGYHFDPNDLESVDWFHSCVLGSNGLILHENLEIGDSIGKIKVLNIIKGKRICNNCSQQISSHHKYTKKNGIYEHRDCKKPNQYPDCRRYI
jgi:hypothetical protein